MYKGCYRMEEKRKQGREIEQVPVEQVVVYQDRRATDLGMHAHTRIAVLEKIADQHEDRISDIEEFHKSVVERFDQKMQLDATNHIIMEKTLTKAVTSIDGLSENLKSACTVANEANKLATKHETIGQITLRFVGALVVIFSAAWTLYTYIHAH